LFTVNLTTSSYNSKGDRYPRCIAGKRACPPEDCGGPWGYGDFLEAIQNPNHEQHEKMLEWSGGTFDPTIPFRGDPSIHRGGLIAYGGLL
jgi:Plasmid pRiA4b ORF-3-like protein